MVRTIVAISDEQLRDSVVRILHRSGIDIRLICRSGQEVLRALKQMDGGIVVCSARLPDMQADELADLLDGTALMLVLARAADLNYCENETIFRIALPVRAGELVGCMRILLQLDEHAAAARMPKRSAEDDAIIEQAKALLMEKNDMSEEHAHRFIQKRSMETATPMPEVAAMILSALG